MLLMLDVHRHFLADQMRTSAYRAAINAVVTPKSVVLDLGAGCGILSFFAAQAGAARVYAVEQQHSADVAQLLARQLGFLDRVEVLHTRSTETVLPELADVLVTETLGSFGLEERILTNVLDARARLLKPDATIIPSRLRLFLAPVEAPTAFADHVEWWSEPRYELDFSSLRAFASNAVYLVDLTPANFLSEQAEAVTIEMGCFTSVDVSGNVSFVTKRDGLMHGFGGFFSALLASGIELSNAVAGSTHWRHVFLPFERPVAVTPGTRVDVELQSHDGVAWRWRGVVRTNPAFEFDQITWLGTPPCFMRTR